LVFALLLVFAAALAFGTDFVFFLATIRAPLLLRTTASHVACRRRQTQNKTKVDGQARTGDRNSPATMTSYTERLRDATAPASRCAWWARPVRPQPRGLGQGIVPAQTSTLEGVGLTPAEVRFSNRPFRVKRFQTIHFLTKHGRPIGVESQTGRVVTPTFDNTSSLD
jgi:hypothetical protein